MNTLKRTLLSFATLMISLASFAQTTTIYGKVTKSDGSRLKGTSTMKGFDEQLIISNYTGGADNTATIEIEVPTASYILDFRSMIKAPATQKSTAIPKAEIAVQPSGKPIAIAPGNITTKSLQIFPISKLEVSLTNRVSNNLPTLVRQIIFENAIVESCTDIVASNTTKIKLKANRIGWIYYAQDAKGNIKISGKSGWDNTTGTAWVNF